MHSRYDIIGLHLNHIPSSLYLSVGKLKTCNVSSYKQFLTALPFL